MLKKFLFRTVQSVTFVFFFITALVRTLRDRFLYFWYALALFGVLATAGALFTIIWAAQTQIPSVEGFKDRTVTQSTKIYDRTGDVILFDVHGDVQRTVVPFDQISRNLKNATIAIEDADFYTHSGIKITSIMRAVFANLSSGELKGQGGSTITQQVVKNTLLSPEKTITRKIKEWVLSLALEKKLTKDEILSIYLNEMPYGGSIYGVEEASKRFFAKSASELTLAESAYIAALPQAPSYYSPYGEHVEQLTERKNLVLQRMKKEGFIEQEEYDAAVAEVVHFAPYGEKNIKAPHFVFWIRDQLEDKYGTDAVYNGGLSVKTTIDWRLQAAAEEIINRYALKNAVDFNAENAALVAIDPKTGQILAMVGSRDYFDEKIDGKYNVATALRQPGSTFKPIAYATAFERGFTPETVVWDVPTQFSVNCPPDMLDDKPNCYSPVNYDDIFRGPMTMRNALAQSINIPAIQTLYLAGPENVLRNARNMGITTLNQRPGFYGFSLVLGGGEVSPLELTNAYATIANNGIYNPATGILEVKDTQGTVIDEYKEMPTQGIDSQAARLVTSVLSDNAARAPSYGVRSFLNFGDIDVAGKTGTTNDFKDVWVAGYTPSIAVVVWAGNNDNSPIVKKVAGYVIAPMWRAYMDQALKYVPHDRFTPPDPLPLDTLQPVLKGDWSNGGQGAHSTLYFIDKNDPRGAPPSNPHNDPQFTNWEFAVQAWLGTHTIDGVAIPGMPLLPGTTTPVNNNPADPNNTLFFTNPTQNGTVQGGVPLTISVGHNGPQEIEKVEYMVNGVYIGSTNTAPFSMTFVPSKRGGLTPIKAVGYLKNNGGLISAEIGVSVE
jgi:1A family penicillin-binding protein